MSGGGGLGSAIGAGVGLASGGGAAAALAGTAIGGSLGGGLFGSGQRVNVPGRKKVKFNKVLGDNQFIKKKFRLSNRNFEGEADAKGLLGNLKDRALSAGPSKSAQYQLDAQGLEEAALRDQAISGQAQAQADARRNLATRGGLGSGASERLASAGANQQALALQGVAGQGALDRTNLLATDEEQKLGLAQALPDAFMKQAQFDMGKRDQDIKRSLELFKQRANIAGANNAARAQGQNYNDQQKGLLGIF